MKKQNLIKGIAFAIIALLISGTFSCAPKSPEKKVGIQLWSVRDDMKTDARATIQAIGKMGYAYIEAAGYNDGKFYGMEPADFKALLDSNGLEFLGSHTGQAAPDSIHWDSTMIWWDKAIAAHKAAGVKFIVQPWMGKEAYESISALDNYCNYFNAVGKKCNEQGIRFGYHNHDGEFKMLDSIIIYDYMLQKTKPELVMFQLDLYWIYKGEKNAVDYFEKYPGRFELFHVKDTAELGTGVMDFKPQFENAEKAGMKYYIVEVERYNFTPLESIQKSLDFLMKAEYTK